MKKINKEISGMILIIFTFIFNISIFAPLEMFYTNKNEFWFEVNDVLPVIIVISIILFAFLFLLGILLKDKKRNIFIKILFGLMLGLYIQGNFLNLGYKVLDGSEIEWGTMIGKGILNTAIWLVILLIPHIFAILKKEKQFKIFSIIVSIFIVLIEIITLTTVVISTLLGEKNTKELVNKEIFNLSKNNNIVVFMSDTFEATYMNQILEEYPEYKEKLKDFTYFDNCTGVSFYTYSSMPTLLTGVECKVGNTLKENVKYCFENSILYKELINNNYNIDLYTEKSLTYDGEYINNLEKVKSNTSLNTKTKLTSKMYEYTLYRYLPHFLKYKFVVNSDEFYNIKREAGETPYGQKTYFLDDVAFNKELIDKGITVKNKQSTFKFYQTNGLHEPYNTTANIEYNYSEEYKEKDSKGRMYEEGIASINLLCNYIKELKDKGIYENTTIIFLADHGDENRFYTTLLVKKANDSKEFNISSAPVSLLEDLVPTILNIATNSKNYGKDFFDYTETEERTRKVYDYTYESNFFNGNEYEVLSKIVFETKGIAKNKEEFYIVSEEYANKDEQLTEKYKFGESIKIDEIRDFKSVNLVGFTLDQIDLATPAGCNIGKNTYLEINSLKSENDVTAEFIINKVYDNEQTINFKIDNETIYTCKVKENNSDNNIKFNIPKDLWNAKDKVTIEIEFPDGKMQEYNKTMMSAIKLSEITFKN